MCTTPVRHLVSWPVLQAGRNTCLPALAAVVTLYLALGIRSGKFGRLGDVAAAMIIGGAIGNVIDRINYGHVIDFLLFYWNNHYYPAF